MNLFQYVQPVSLCKSIGQLGRHAGTCTQRIDRVVQLIIANASVVFVQGFSIRNQDFAITDNHLVGILLAVSSPLYQVETFFQIITITECERNKRTFIGFFAHFVDSHTQARVTVSEDIIIAGFRWNFQRRFLARQTICIEEQVYDVAGQWGCILHLAAVSVSSTCSTSIRAIHFDKDIFLVLSAFGNHLEQLFEIRIQIEFAAVHQRFRCIDTLFQMSLIVAIRQVMVFSESSFIQSNTYNHSCSSLFSYVTPVGSNLTGINVR